ncbi:MAG: ribosome small subunit-dependent GTPase A [Coriobacteriia bacterium]|nr:ribosome small subunit-dependent GTPase A [Coriobacteriia bacterium]
MSCLRRVYQGILEDVTEENPHLVNPHEASAADAASRPDEPPRDLAALGFTERFEALFAPHRESGFIPARVSRIDRGQPLLLTGDGTVRAELATHLRESGDVRIAVGDWVALGHPEGHDLAIIEVILARSSAFIRKDPGENTLGQVLVANIDTVFVVQSLFPRGPNLARLERELVLAWGSGARPVVVLTKADLATDADAMRDEVAAVAFGVDVHVTSAVSGFGVNELVETYLGPGSTAAFFGASGVGKSTLVNELVGNDVAETREVRGADGKGRHTTVAREMFFLPGGGILIDTPGMRALALWDAEDGIESTFPDIAGLAGECRFADCSHVLEPGCAVRRAIDSGALAERRLESYIRLNEELQRLGERQDVLARTQKKREDKVLAREIKRFNKNRGR